MGRHYKNYYSYFIPLNLVISLLLVSGGVIQNWKSAETVSLVEPIAVSSRGEIIENAQIDLSDNTVTVDGHVVKDAQICKRAVCTNGASCKSDSN